MSYREASTTASEDEESYAAATGHELSEHIESDKKPRQVRALRQEPGKSSVVSLQLLNEGNTPRLAGVDHEHVHLLARMDVQLPPILVHRSTMRVIDGMHRLHAAAANGRESIAVEFFDGPEDAAFVRAVEANIRHGLPLSLADRRAAAIQIMQLFPHWSDRAVADTAGLSDKTVASLRGCASADVPQTSHRVGRDGRLRPVDSTAGRLIASELLGERPGVSLREVARAAGVSVATVRDVRARLSREEDPLPASGRSRRVGRRGDSDAQSNSGTLCRCRTGQAATDPDPTSLLVGLQRDPSLRYSEAGRAVLQLLATRVIRPQEWSGVREQIPPHAAMLVAELARRCAEAWTRVATELEPSEPAT